MDLTIRGWMREAERMALRRWAFGLDVLELGSYQGLSTSQLLATAQSVHAVDTFDGRGTVHFGGDTRETFHANMRATGNYGKLATFPGEFSVVLPKMKTDGREYDLIFIDGSHDCESVRQDIALSRPLLKPGGAILFHDHNDQHPGVMEAVAELARDGWKCHEQIDSLALFRNGDPAPKPKVYIRGVMPHRGDLLVNLGSAWAMDSRFSQKYNRKITDFGVSVLTQCFNTLWCDAINDQMESGKYTHFLMLHNDVVPERYFADVLVEEMEKHDLDMLSAVVPLKAGSGVTSTGVSTPDYEFSVRRLTMKEVFDLPVTFTRNDLPKWSEGQELLLNTGCWIMRFDRPWWRGLKFRQQDDICISGITGKYIPASISEDWDWSRQLISRGCRIGATRAVKLYHDRPIFHNQGVWGDWQEDMQYLEDTRAAREFQSKVVESLEV